MNHRDTNSDGAIDRVLSGLREVEPLQGMQQRVLRGATEGARAPRHWSLLSSLTSKRAWIAATACIAVIALATSWTIARSHRTSDKTAESSAQPLQTNPPKPESYKTPLPVRQVSLPRATTLALSERPAAPVPPLSDEDALALSEMNAPSLPAPPMPLTEQEKLLVRLIDKGDPIEMAMLDPRLRSSEEASSRADFDRFFASPTSTDTKPTTGDNK